MTNERERALGNLIDFCDASMDLEPDGTKREIPQQMMHAMDILKTCVPVPRAEYDRLRRFVVEIMKDMGLGTFGIYHCHDETGFDMLVEMGFIEAREKNKITTWWWTEAAHEFAARMREKDGK